MKTESKIYGERKDWCFRVYYRACVLLLRAVCVLLEGLGQRGIYKGFVEACGTPKQNLEQLCHVHR